MQKACFLMTWHIIFSIVRKHPAIMPFINYISRDIRKPDFCICENKDADQLRGITRIPNVRRDSVLPVSQTSAETLRMSSGHSGSLQEYLQISAMSAQTSAMSAQKSALSAITIREAEVCGHLSVRKQAIVRCIDSYSLRTSAVASGHIILKIFREQTFQTLKFAGTKMT